LHSFYTIAYELFEELTRPYLGWSVDIFAQAAIMNFTQLPIVANLLGRKGRAGHQVRQEGVGSSTLGYIGELLWEDDVLLEVSAKSKRALMDVVGHHMEAVHAISHPRVARGLEQREKIGSTAIGFGVAIPHARIMELDRIQVAYLRLKSPIPFDAPDGIAVSDIFVLLVPKQATQEHLLLLAEVSQLFAERRFREALHRCASPQQVKKLFTTWASSTQYALPKTSNPC
jgi:PTS system nitrogen regulatory IIA component